VKNSPPFQKTNTERNWGHARDLMWDDNTQWISITIVFCVLKISERIRSATRFFRFSANSI